MLSVVTYLKPTYEGLKVCSVVFACLAGSHLKPTYEGLKAR